jgi:hypothetical protein
VGLAGAFAVATAVAVVGLAITRRLARRPSFERPEAAVAIARS